MAVSRRGFVTTASFSLANAVSQSFARGGTVTRNTEGYTDWSAVRAEFDLAPGWLHLSQFFFVSHPRPVRDSIEKYRRLLDASPFLTVEHGMRLDQQKQGESIPWKVQQAVGRYLGGQRNEVALTDSTTPGSGAHLPRTQT